MASFRDTLTKSSQQAAKAPLRNSRPIDNKPYNVNSKTLSTPKKPVNSKQITPAAKQAQVSENDNNVRVLSMSQYVYNLMLESVSEFATLDTNFLKLNNNLYDTDGVIESEREISFDVMTYLAEYFSVLCAALVLDYKHCRDAFASGIEEEIALSEMSKEEHEIARAKLEETDDPIPFTYSMHIGITMFNDETLQLLLNRVANGFEKLNKTDLKNVLDDATNNLSEDDKLIIGMIVSNYVYFIRGCNHNVKFFTTVCQIIEFFKADYNLGELF